MLGCFSLRDRDDLTHTSDGDQAPDRRVACRAASGCDGCRAGARLVAMVRHYRCAPDCRPWRGSRRIAVGGRGRASPVRPGLPAMVRCTRLPVEPSHARLLFVAGSRWPDPDVARRPPAPPTRRPSGGIRRRPVAALVRGCRAWLGTTGARRIAVAEHGSALPVRVGSRLLGMVRHSRCALDCRPWCGARQIAVGGRGPHFPCTPDWRPWCGARRIAVGGHGSAFPVHPGLAAMVRFAPDRGWRPWFGITGAPRIAGHGPVHPDPGRAEPCSAAFRRGIAMA